VRSESRWDWPGMEAVSEVSDRLSGDRILISMELIVSHLSAALCALQAKKAENANVHPESKKMDALVP
jgi:hypothetical protein